MPGKQKRQFTPPGFSLIEVLLAVVLLALLAAGTLQSAVFLHQQYEWTVRQRGNVMRKWNESRRLRLRKAPSPARILPVTGAAPLYRHRIDKQGSGLTWEVWVGEF